MQGPFIRTQYSPMVMASWMAPVNTRSSSGVMTKGGIR